jgi:hypothetical protein
VGYAGAAAETKLVITLEATTFIELLVVGLQVATWLTLLISALLGPGCLASFSAAAKGFELLVTGFVLGFTYLMGVIPDRADSSLVGAIENKCVCMGMFDPDRVCSDAQARAQELIAEREYVITRSDQATAQLAYMRSRIRILRSSLINIPLIAGAALWFVGARGSGSLPRGQVMWLIGLAGAILTALTVVAFRGLTASYWYRVQDFYVVLATTNGKEHG